MAVAVAVAVAMTVAMPMVIAVIVHGSGLLRTAPAIAGTFGTAGSVHLYGDVIDGIAFVQHAAHAGDGVVGRCAFGQIGVQGGHAATTGELPHMHVVHVAH